jgi:signal transduction histidine kinase
MTSSGNSPTLLIDCVTSTAAAGKLDIPLDLASELVFTQDASGRYLSFWWQASEQFGFSSHHLVSQSILEVPNLVLAPVVVAPYLKRIRQVLEQQTPDRFQYPFYCAGHYFVFDLTLSPLLVPYGSPEQVVITGKPLYTSSQTQAIELANSVIEVEGLLNPLRLQKLLTQLAWNISRSLNIRAIGQQAVEGIGEALRVSRCLFCFWLPDNGVVEVIAEHCLGIFPSVLGKTFQLADEPYLQQAISALQPVVLTATSSTLEPRLHAVVAIATHYQNEPNGLILLHQFDRLRIMGEAELELISELAHQIGISIAHANLFASSQNLAEELQQANENLRKQHEHVEEARQQAEEASRLKSDFLANTSHELRTPLNGMIGFLKLIMDGMADDPVEQGEFIEEAYRSAVHLLNIINDILDIAKIEAGKMQLDLDPVKLDDLLTDVENLTRTQAHQKGLSFKILTPATRDEVILSGNFQRLLQVMLNLVGNAIKFTHEGGITISAEVVPKKVTVLNQERVGYVKISVADTGIGVSLEKQDKLFQSFSQVDGSRTRQYGGTGLGLAISQKLVEAMGGVVNFYSLGEGLGSTVTFTVPLYQDPVMISDEIQHMADVVIPEPIGD